MFRTPLEGILAQPATDWMAQAGVVPPPDPGFSSVPGETRPVAAL